MADEFELRSFVGDPNPPPSASQLATLAPSSPPAAKTVNAGMGVPPAEVKEQEFKGEGEFWVSAPGKDGKHRVYNTTPDGENHELGVTSVPDIGGILDAVVKRNAATGSWRGVPKQTALSLMSGELGIVDHVHAMYDAGKAGTAEGMIGWQALSGKMSDVDALDKSDPELLKMQVESPFKPWSDGRLASMVSAAPWALGVAAKALPSMVAGVGRGAELAPGMLAGAAALAATGGPAGLAALATPVGLSTVLGASASAGMFDFTFKVTAGSIYMDLRRKDVDPAVAKRMAPVAGIMAGALEIVGFKYFTAAAKRTFANKVLGNTAVKAQMTRWYANYLKETGAEAGVESAQQVVEEYTKTFALMADNKPEMMKSQKDIAKAVGQAGVEAFVAFGVLKAPMAGVEGVASKTEGKVKAEVAPVPAAEMAKAPTLEQELVAETPDVARTLADLNTQLDPTSPDAQIIYGEMGKELAGHEDAAAAVVAKTEALRMEMLDILAEEGNTPLEQARVGEIQHELGLLEGMQAQMEGAGEQGITDTEFQSGDSVTVPMVESGAPISSLRQKVNAAVLKARDAKLVSEMKNNSEMTAELMRTRDRLERAGKSVAGIDNALRSLQTEAMRLDELRRGLGTITDVAPSEKLELTPATLESITKVAFKEGRKNVVVKRAGFINEIAAQHSLSDHDIKTLTKNRNLGVMSDPDFKKYLDDLRVKAKELAEKKQAYFELETTKQIGEFKKEDNLRKILSLPPVSKMTATEMRIYARALEEFEQGDEFWSQKRAEVLADTPWGGVTTVREVVEKMAKDFGVTPETLEGVKASWMNRFQYDAVLAEQNPLYAFIIHRAKMADLKGISKFFDEDVKFEQLAQAALDSRKRGFWAGIVDWFAPQQKVIRQYMETTDPKEKAAIAATMTGEEIAFADHEAEFFSRAYDYLLARNDLESSRYEDSYVAYTRKPISEILFRYLPETGVTSAIKEILDSWKSDETRFRAVDDAGQHLGYSKFFAHALYRSGEMKPSENMIRSFRNYRRQFFKKQALDEMVPMVDTAVAALKAVQKTAGGEQMMDAIHNFSKMYLNAQKGQAAFAWIPQGSTADGLIRAATQMVSLMYMGGNLTLQIASEIGATIPKIPLLGVTGYTRAKYRKTTRQGGLILARHKGFIGEGPLTEFMKAGVNLEERATPALFALFAWSRKSMLEDVLLGSMTEAEFKAGEVSLDRLADIKLEASKWIDVGRMKSVFGRSSVGTAQMQYKSWAVPTTLSLIRLATKLSKSLATRKVALSTKEKMELFRVVYTASFIAAAHGVFDDLKDEDSFLGRLAARAYLEFTNSLTAGFDVGFFTSGPAAVGWILRLISNLWMLVTLQRTESERGKGKLRGAEGLKRQMTPAIIRQFVSDRRKKKGPPKPFKRNQKGGG